MAGRNFILLLRNIIFSKNMVTWKSIRDLRLPWKLSHVNRNLSTKFSLVTTSDFMVGFSSVVDCQRSLKVIIMKLLSALKIIIFLPIFWMCLFFEAVSIFSRFQWFQLCCQFSAEKLAKREDFKRKGLEQITVLEIYNPVIGKAFLSHAIFQTFKED